MAQRDVEGLPHSQLGEQHRRYGPLDLDTVERIGVVALVLTGAGALVTLAAALIFAGVTYPLLVWNQDPPRREGAELVIFPVVAALTMLLWRPPHRRIETLRASHLGPWIPLSAAFALVGIIIFLAWEWGTHGAEAPIGPARVLGGVLIAFAGFSGVIINLRLTVVMASALAAAALFTLLVLPFSHKEPYSPVLFFLVYGSWVGGPLALGIASRLLRPRLVSSAALSGAIALFLAVFGYVLALSVSD